MKSFSGLELQNIQETRVCSNKGFKSPLNFHLFACRGKKLLSLSILWFVEYSILNNCKFHGLQVLAHRKSFFRTRVNKHVLENHCFLSPHNSNNRTWKIVSEVRTNKNKLFDEQAKQLKERINIRAFPLPPHRHENINFLNSYGSNNCVVVHPAMPSIRCFQLRSNCKQNNG